MDSTDLDYTLDRIGHLERKVQRLEEELRQIRDDPGAVSAKDLAD